MPTTRKWGVALCAVALAGIPVSALVALVTANACGPFGDACEDYGQTAPGFGPAMGALAAFVMVLMAGVALILVPRRDVGDG